MVEKNKKEKEEVVEVSKSALDELIKKIDRLERASDKGRLAGIDSRFFKRGPNQFLLGVVEDKGKQKIITGWRVLKNVSYRDPRTRGLVEDMQYEVLFHDNTKMKVLGYLEFSDMRYNNTIKVEETGRNTNEETTSINVKVIDENSEFFGKELLVDVEFLN